jgi:hypothetical protein
MPVAEVETALAFVTHTFCSVFANAVECSRTIHLHV